MIIETRFEFVPPIRIRKVNPIFIHEIIPDSMIDRICKKETEGCKYEPPCSVCKLDEKRYAEYLRIKKLVKEDKFQGYHIF